MVMVSIVVPAYNVEKYIEHCVESILKQTYTNFQLILVDDGSTDATGFICDSLASKDERVEVYHTENRGVSAARNLGIMKAKGTYITFIDADDEVTSEFIDCLVYPLNEETAYDLVVGGAVFRTDNNSKDTIRNVDTKNLKGDIWIDFPYIQDLLKAPWGKLYKKKIIEENNIFFPEMVTVAEDQIFNLHFSTKVHSYKIIKETEYIYFIRNESTLSKLATKASFIGNVMKLREAKYIFSKYNPCMLSILSDEFNSIVKYHIVLEDDSNTYRDLKSRIKVLYAILGAAYNPKHKRWQRLCLNHGVFFPLIFKVWFKYKWEKLLI